ncbi:hypothetical protein [Paraburkholderia terrae]|uniref:hypothetical protein n=1 Tax=Paraburkholderia terrae TaxID=311230 RepID=UPI001EE2E032|nr:hypothetical protein [Paraburkholderia terrae]GJH00234.1 hypothetical protein CBA19C8_06775 [Paraburkholderia terrae]
MSTKVDRAVHANQLIRAIASHGRRFFYNARADRYARIELDVAGRVWFIDDYRESRIYTHRRGSWNRMGFSHGGTLHSLVDDMREYIVHGTRIPRWKIAIRQLGNRSENIWGYSPEAAEAVRAAAYALPIMEPEKDGA